jgi:acetylornithine/N-succinyldiaminopimelate aminotransferase
VNASHLMPTYRPAAIQFVRGQGSELFDAEGRRYLDLLSGIAVTSLGHAHPKLAAAVAEQAGRLWHVSNLFGHDLAEPLAEQIDLLIGDGQPAGGRVFFGNSGAEANECAIKLARRAAPGGRYVVVTALGSFHGRTLATLHATGQPEKHVAFAPLPEGFRHVPYDDVDALEQALRAPDVAALLLEAVQGEGGVVVPSPGYLAAARKLCDEAGVLLVLDEIQTGLGRTGRWFGFHHEEVLPDVVTLAKALGNGMPIGACWATADVSDAFGPGDHGSTFGGQPLACSAALATLSVMREEDVPRRAAERGAHLAERLRPRPGVQDVRGKGLLIGVVLDQALEAATVVPRALEHGVVVNSPVPGVLRLAPSLLISEAQVDEAARRLAQALESAMAGSAS